MSLGPRNPALEEALGKGGSSKEAVREPLPKVSVVLRPPPPREVAELVPAVGRARVDVGKEELGGRVVRAPTSGVSRPGRRGPDSSGPSRLVAPNVRVVKIGEKVIKAGPQKGYHLSCWIPMDLLDYVRRDVERGMRASEIVRVALRGHYGRGKS
jgi:hypothetical protein